MNELDILIAEAEIGEEARRFLESDIGRLVIGKAQQEVDDALFSLKTIDHTNAAEIQKLQNHQQ